MKYLLDTDTVSFLYDRKSQNLGLRSHIDQRNSYFVSALTLFELEYSLANAPDEIRVQIYSNIRTIEAFFYILPLSSRYASIYGQLKSALKEKYRLKPSTMKKHNIDLMIASTALAENATLVSNDKLYSQIASINPNFHFENWIVGT